MTAIVVENLSVAYKLYSKPMDVLREVLLGGRRHDTFWALRDVSVRIEEGDRIGIVGPNGAGKSTLLKVIAGNLIPTSGRVSVNGKISSLLSLTPAWNEEMTGIENARFNLAMQGAPESRIRLMLEDIADFTELGAFLTRPVRTYSSGMSARLSFAIATALDPEILIVDEVLGTGDGYFAAKAAARMKKFCDRGRALLFVSHSTYHVRTMCQKCVWIENGAVRLAGPAETVIRQYEEDMLRKDEATNREGNQKRIEKALHSVSPEDLKFDDLWYLRLRSREGLQLRDTHYVKNIRVGLDDAEVEVPLDIVDIKQPEVPVALDPLSCEWGRMFDRLGAQSRTLTSRIGVRKGGYILLKRTAATQSVLVRCSFEYASVVGNERLIADVLDVSDGNWVTLATIKEEELADGWRRVVAERRIDVPDAVAHRNLLERSTEEHKRPVEIVDVRMLTKQGPSVQFREGDAFRIAVDLKANEVVDTLNVSINIFRSDGVYVFYQASCFDRIVSGSDEISSVEFKFDPNPLGAGDYEVIAYATNSFSADQGPPTEIYDKHAGRRFAISLSRAFDCGLVHTRVPVTFVAASATKELEGSRQ